MRQDIKSWVLACDVCQRIKSYNKSTNTEYQMVKSEKTGDLISVDLYGPLPMSRGGVQYIFVVLDVFSKLVRLYSIKKATSYIVSRKICEQYVSELGRPQRILSDHGTQFTSKRWKKSLQDLGIRVLFSSIRHPQGNPVERVMREIGRMFRALCSDKHTAWASYVPRVEHILNLCTHLTTGFAPQELHFGTQVNDEVQKIIKFPEGHTLSRDAMYLLACERMEQAFLARKKKQGRLTTVSFAENDWVYLKVPRLSKATDSLTHKFFDVYEGPFSIMKVLGN